MNLSILALVAMQYGFTPEEAWDIAVVSKDDALGERDQFVATARAAGNSVPAILS